jgi:uncharacterized membrane protein
VAQDGAAADQAAAEEPAAEARSDSPHRMFALADGIFAISMTLLALDVRIGDAVPETADGFNDAAADFYGKFGIFFLGFMIAGRFWIANHAMMSRLHKVDTGLLERTVLFLAGISSLPVVTPLLFRFGNAPQAVAFASVLLAATSLLSARLWWYLSDPERRLSDVDPDTRLSTLVRPLFNTGIFLLAVPTAFVLTNTDARSGYSPLVWLLLLFDVRFSRLVIGLLRRAR